MDQEAGSELQRCTDLVPAFRNGGNRVRDAAALLLPFLFHAREHPRLGATHISLFAALVVLYCQRGGEPVPIKRREVMALAKMSSATYHKCLRVLIECGFVVYYPCSNPKGTSQIYFAKDPPEKDVRSAGVQRVKR